MKILPLIPKVLTRPPRPAERPGAGHRTGTPTRTADVIRLSPDRGRPSQMALEEALALLDDEFLGPMRFGQLPAALVASRLAESEELGQRELEPCHGLGRVFQIRG